MEAFATKPQLSTQEGPSAPRHRPLMHDVWLESTHQALLCQDRQLHRSGCMHQSRLQGQRRRTVPRQQAGDQSWRLLPSLAPSQKLPQVGRNIHSLTQCPSSPVNYCSSTWPRADQSCCSTPAPRPLPSSSASAESPSVSTTLADTGRITLSALGASPSWPRTSEASMLRRGGPQTALPAPRMMRQQ